MNLEIARQRYKDVFLPDVIDNSQGDFLAKHVPMKVLFFTDHADLTEADKKQTKTESELYEQIFAESQTEDQFILVKGASGAGKSHLIRWFETMLEVRKPDNEIVLYIRRADNTLKGTIRQLISLPEVQNLPNKELYKKLASASTTIPEIELKNTIYYAFVNLVESDDGRGGEAEERIISNVDRKHLVALLQNSLFKDRLMDVSGPIDRIYTKIAENKTFEINDQAAQFDSMDFEIDAEFRSDLINTGADDKARKIADKLLGNDEFVGKIVFYMNKFIEKVVQRCTGLEPGDLRSVIEEIRQELYRQEQNLTILIEDITAASGVDDSLLDALLTNKSGYLDRKLCRIRSIVGVADGYYRENFRSNTKGRIKQFINVPDEMFNGDTDGLIEFFARYLNTVSLPVEVIDKWVSEKANSDLYPVHDATIRRGWDELQLGEKVIDLYPFTKRAIVNLYKAQDMSQRNPRAIMRNIIEPLVKEAIDDRLEEDFPKDYNVNTTLLPEIANKNYDTATAYRLSRFIQIWGNGTADIYVDKDIRYIAGIPESIFEELGLPLLDGKVVDKPKEEIKPQKLVDVGNQPNLAELTVLENSQVSIALKEVDRWIENQEYRLSIGATTKNVRALNDVRKNINDYLFGVIDWVSEGVPIDAMVKIRDTQNKFLVAFERQTMKSDAVITLSASIESRRIIESFLRYGEVGNKSWDFPGSTDYLYRVQRWVDKIKPTIVKAVMTYQDKNISYFSYATAAEFYRLILNGYCKAYQKPENFAVSLLLQKNPDVDGENGHSDSWNKLQKITSGTDGVDNRNTVLQYYNLPQGTSISSTNYEIDYVKFNKAVKKVIGTGLRYEEDELQLDDPVRKRRLTSEYFKKILDRLSIVVEDEKKQLAQNMEFVEKLIDMDDIDEDAIKDVVKSVKNFYVRAQDSHISAAVHVDNALINACAKNVSSIWSSIKLAQEIMQIEDDVESLIRLSRDPLATLAPFVKLIKQADSDVQKAKMEIQNRMQAYSSEANVEKTENYKTERAALNSCKEKIEEVKNHVSNG